MVGCGHGQVVGHWSVVGARDKGCGSVKGAKFCFGDFTTELEGQNRGYYIVDCLSRISHNWRTTNQATQSKKKEDSSNHYSHEVIPKSSSVGNMDSNQELKNRSFETKAAKEMHKQGKIYEGAIFAQAATTKVMATSKMQKATLLKDHNIFIIMITKKS